MAFAVKRGGGAWRRIAADQSPPFRGFLDPTRFRRGERVHVVALARWPDGRTTVVARRRSGAAAALTALDL